MSDNQKDTKTKKVKQQNIEKSKDVKKSETGVVNNSTSAVEEKEIKDTTTKSTEEEKDDKVQKKPKNNVKEETSENSFSIGDSVKVFYKIVEGNKVRVQPYEGIVIAIKGKGDSKTFTVRRIGTGQIGIERIFPIKSPNIEKIEITKYGKVRRAKLYYLRDKIGKAATKIKEKKVEVK